MIGKSVINKDEVHLKIDSKRKINQKCKTKAGIKLNAGQTTILNKYK